jgi:isocitrate dehydrogenase (NAD+)
MIHKAVLIPGDGIGPEVSAATRSVLKAAGAPLKFEQCPAGEAAREVGERITKMEFAQAVAGRL